MPFLPGLSVVFVGIAGGGKVDQQVASVVQAAHVERTKLPIASVRTLARHGDGAHELVAKLHVDGIIAGELVIDHGQASLHLVIYKGDGGMKSYNEMSIAGRAMTKTELEVLRSNVEDEVAALLPKEQPKPLRVAETMTALPAQSTLPKLAKADPRPKPRKQVVDPFADSEIEMDATPMIGEKHTVEAPHAAAAVQTASADAVGADEIEALMKGSGSDIDNAAPGGGIAITRDTTLHLGADVGLGFQQRSFTPGPATVAGYSSAPVGALRAAGHVEPTDRIRLAASIEHTLSMSTPLAAGAAPTSMGRWEVEGSYAITRGGVELRARGGVGHRSFSIDSADPARSPDGDYSYLIAGATAAVPVGERFRIEGGLAFEPVFGGAEPTMMAFGAASRWALDGSIAAELRLQHVFVRGQLDYQRFAWSWDSAGTRGAGGAVDSYPSGTVSVGAHY